MKILLFKKFNFGQIGKNNYFVNFQVTFVEGGDGKATAELKLGKEHLNKMGGMHGGFSSTLGNTKI